ncbi:hypothetical protein D3C87_1552950 [compost metagenome]
MANVGAVGLMKSLLNKGLERAPKRVLRQCSDELHWRRFGLAEMQRQLNIPVEIGHCKIPPRDNWGEVSKAILNEV